MKFVVSTTSVSPSQWPTRVAEPLADVSVRTSVDGDDAAVAVLLVKNRHVAGALHDTVVAAVGALPHHSRDAVGQAAFAGIRIQVGLERSDSVPGCRACLRFPGLRGIRESFRRADPRSARSACRPSAAVRGPARSCCIRSRESVIRKRGGGPPRRLRRRQAVSRPGLLRCACRCASFFVGQELAALELSRPLERNRRFVSPDALEIRIAPRACAASVQGPLLRRARLRRVLLWSRFAGHQRDDADDCQHACDREITTYSSYRSLSCSRVRSRDR